MTLASLLVEKSEAQKLMNALETQCEGKDMRFILLVYPLERNNHAI